MGDTRWRDLPKLISRDTVDALADALKQLSQQQRRGFSVVLHGGEPLLLGPARLEHLLARLRSSIPLDYPISIQTNGVLISEAILDVCAQHKATVAVSIDGPESIHDKHRTDGLQRGTYARAMSGLARLNGHPRRTELYAGLLAVVDPTSDPEAVYRFFKGIAAESVDFLYRDGNHSRLPAGKSSFESTEYGQWMVRLLEVYLVDPEPLEIRVLDDMLRVILGGRGTKEGLGLEAYGIVIVDTDGSFTKNDTLKSAYPLADQFLGNWNVHDHDLAELLRSEEYARYTELQHPQSAECRECPILSICGGGMTLHRWRDETRYDNPSVYCADQKHLIGRMQALLSGVATGR